MHLLLFTCGDWDGTQVEGRHRLTQHLWSLSDAGERLEKEMATHPSLLAWEIPRTEEPVRLQSRGPQESDMTLVTEKQQKGERINIRAIKLVAAAEHSML